MPDQLNGGCQVKITLEDDEGMEIGHWRIRSDQDLFDAIRELRHETTQCLPDQWLGDDGDVSH